MERAGAGAAMYRIEPPKDCATQSVLRAWRTYARPYAVSSLALTVSMNSSRAATATKYSSRPDNLEWALTELQTMAQLATTRYSERSNARSIRYPLSLGQPPLRR